MLMEDFVLGREHISLGGLIIQWMVERQVVSQGTVVLLTILPMHIEEAQEHKLFLRIVLLLIHEV
jgi:hypothetical protein